MVNNSPFFLITWKIISSSIARPIIRAGIRFVTGLKAPRTAQPYGKGSNGTYKPCQSSKDKVGVVSGSCGLKGSIGNAALTAAIETIISGKARASPATIIGSISCFLLLIGYFIIITTIGPAWQTCS